MSDERFHELLALLLDDELTAEQEAELCRGLEARPELRHEVRAHLALWERWSQQVNAERSGEAFVAGWRTRMRAEERADAETFTQRVLTSLPPEKPRIPWWRVWWPLELAAACAIVALIFLLGHRPSDEPPVAQSRPAPRAVETPNVPTPEPGLQLVSLRGEGVCTHCTLGEDGPHRMALRMPAGQAGAQPAIYLFEDGEAMHGQMYCAQRPQLIARGTVRASDGRPLLHVQSLERVP